MPKFCIYCGAPLEEDYKFCGNCGKPIAEQALPVQPEPQPVQPEQPIEPAPAPVKAPVQPPVQQPPVQQPAPVQQPPKKKSKAGLVAALVSMGVILAIVGITQFTGGGNGGGPARTVGKEGYSIDLPEGSGNVKVEAVPERKMEGLQNPNYEIIGRPVNVTRNGNDHVEFDQMARVSFAIPKSIPKEEYINLMGVLIVDDKPVYMVPDYVGIQNGVVTFETSHFCVATATKVDDIFRREEFINRVAASDWYAGACNKDLEKSVKETLKEAAATAGFGDDKLMGVALREIISDNDFINHTIDLIDAYDESGGDSNAVAEKVAEKVAEAAKTKILSTLFAKLKADIEKEEMFVDPRSGKLKATTVIYEKEYKGLVEELEGHLTEENMQELGKRLGQGDSPASIAADYGKGLFKDWLEDFATEMVPQVKLIQKTAKTMKILKEFWASNTMNEMFEDYCRECDSNGNLNSDDWNRMFIHRCNAAESKYGMSEEEIKEQFRQRYLNDRDINNRKANLRELILLYENTSRYELMDSPVLKNMDYIQKLTRIHMLVERFRKELVDETGWLPGKAAGKTVNETLCEIVEQYLKFYPDQEAFYKWLADSGFYGNKLKKLRDGLDGFRCWQRVRVEIEKGENEGGEHPARFNASELQHSAHYSWSGDPFQDLNDPSGERWYRPYSCSTTSSISAPPEFIEAGDSVVMHLSIQASGSSNSWTHIGDAWVRKYYHGTSQPTIRNIVGSETVGTGTGMPTSGEWDAVLYFSGGYKGDELCVEFGGSGSSTRWYYKWCSLYEKDEQ